MTTHVAVQPESEDWDADHTEKRRKYFLVGLIRANRPSGFPRLNGVVSSNPARASTSPPPPPFVLLSQHDDREREAEGKAADGRGRGSFSRGRARFIVRNTGGPKWADDNKFQVNGEHQETRQDHKDGEDT